MTPLSRALRRLLLVPAIMAIVFMAIAVPSSCASPPEPLVISYAPFESTALMWIAEDERFFARNGLDMSFRKYDTGAGALDAMLKGEADITMGTADFPTVGRAFRKESFRIIGNADKADFIYIIARRDRGIEKVSDLKDKKVGTTLGTVAHFHLGRFLNLNGLSIEDVQLVDLKTPAEWVDAVAVGDVDAIATAQPYAKAARDAVGDNAVFWMAQSSQPVFGLIVSRQEWVEGHPELVTRFLKSLAQAEEYLTRNPAKAKTIVQERLNLDAAYVEKFWSQNQFGLSLDQSLIAAMEDEARWMINNGLTTEKQVPDFLDYIHEDELKALKPDAVNIIR